MIGTINCIYETPCGWCTKWDKKCDGSLPKRGQRAKAGILDDNFKPCDNCESNGWDMPECRECNIGNGFKYYKGVN